VVAISEALHHQLQGVGIPIGVSILCPGYVKTDFRKNNVTSQTTRDVVGNDPLQQKITNFKLASRTKSITRVSATGITTDELVDILMQGLEKKDFYIFPFNMEHSPILEKFIKMFESHIP
jgi:short-subunit dehydrogenase